ncbi:MAG TPA: hypothetical protein VHU13_06300 [Solirubrobacteraceae bacterium]|jgi:hypothetical protein|nr:hypothetical protein [Solirubrobacteraceae bacterium]
MHQLTTTLARRLVLAIALGTLSALALAACGGSSAGSSGTSSNAAATSAVRSGTEAGTSVAHGANGKSATATPPARRRFGALRECLQRNGIKLPTQRGGARGLFLGGAQLPAGVTRSQMQAAMRKCLGGRPSRPAAAGAFRRSNTRFRQALSRFADCLRQSGVNVPAPNPSGAGPLFSTKGIDTASQKFRAATKKCRGVLTAAFRP